MSDNPSKLRGFLGVTQSRLAKMCNTAIGTVRKWIAVSSGRVVHR